MALAPTEAAMLKEIAEQVSEISNTADTRLVAPTLLAFAGRHYANLRRAGLIDVETIQSLALRFLSDALANSGDTPSIAVLGSDGKVKSGAELN